MADPYFSSVVLLAVNDNKANGTTSFADQSNAARTLTANGNIVYSNTSAPTGMSTSAFCDGLGDYLSSVNSTDFNFGSGDFTVEAEINFSTQPTAIIIAKDDTTNRSWHLAWVSGTGWQFAYFVSGSQTLYRPGTGTIVAGTFAHVALCRSGTNVRIFVDGNPVGTAHNIGTASIDAKNCLQTDGASGVGSFSFNGFISNIRITKGVARYTSAFTPPSLPFDTVGVTPPVADFTGTPTSGTTPLSVSFTDASTNTPTSWLWDFGDSTTSTSQNPTHVYSAAGTYTVALTATNAGGSNQNTKTGYITVTAANTQRPGTIISFAARGVDWSEVERIKLEKALARKKAELKKVAKKIKAAEKKVETQDPPRGILANLHLLEQKEAKLQVEIAEIAINLESMVDFLSKLQFEDDDEDDDWLHLI